MTEVIRVAHLETPIGLLAVSEAGGAIIRADFIARSGRRREGESPVLRACLDQLREYFDGRRRAFDVPLDLRGTDFQRRVWGALLQVPFGRTSTYARVAASIGRPKAVRAVGAANGRNPISIIVPCHRILGSSGDLVGYGGGLWRKEWLLRHESQPSLPLR